MLINLNLVPYDTGRRAWRMGAGPEHFLSGGLEAFLSSAGHHVRTQTIETGDPSLGEIATAFELYGKLAELVRSVEEAGAFPVVLSGNCGAALGTVSGLSAEPLGIIWFDAHGDFNTPETTASGFLDGMGLAAAAGLCWKKLVAKIPHFHPVSGQRILHVGGNDIEADELALMLDQGVTLCPLETLRQTGIEALLPALDRLQSDVRGVYVHLDLDVLDPQKTRANHFPSSAGLDADQVKAILHLIRERMPILAVGVASYDPAYDPQGATLRAGMKLISEAGGEAKS